jgi:hypothetical protein
MQLVCGFCIDAAKRFVGRKDAFPQNLGFRTDEKSVLRASLCVVSEKRKFGEECRRRRFKHTVKRLIRSTKEKGG